MQQAILRLALTTDGGKWLPGAVLGVYPPSRTANSFGPDGQGGFALIMAETARFAYEEMLQWRLMKMVDLDSFMSPLSKQARLAQKENIRVERTGKLDFQITLQEVTVKPRFDKIVDLDAPGCLIGMPPEFQPKPTVII